MKIKVLVYPYDKNPYQRLLYSAMSDVYGSKIRIKYMWFLPFVGALHIPLELVVRRIMGYRVIHIHWIAFYIRQHIPGHWSISSNFTRFNIWWIKLLGYKLVWTVHDITPHQKETNDDLAISKVVASAADIKIIHSSFTRQQLTSRGLDSNRSVVIPHGNYDGVYESTVSPARARELLGIPSDHTVFLFFGIIKTYKGIEDLLTAYRQVRKSKTMLVIAGSCSSSSLVAILQRAALKKDVLLFNEYIKDEDVPKFFQACNVVCLPFKAITTSGSTLLALTFGKPIVAPRDGSLRDLPLAVGHLYDPKVNGALVDAMRTMLNDKRAQGKMAVAARNYADTLAWSTIAKRTYRVYERLYNGQI